jgi:hypothetical protein
VVSPTTELLATFSEAMRQHRSGEPVPDRLVALARAVWLAKATTTVDPSPPRP